MMRKLVFADSFNYGTDMPLATLADDPQVLRKTASSPVVDQWGDIEPVKDHSLVHLIALGDYEHTGCYFAGTQVQTSTGMQAIEDIKVGDLVLTHKNRYRRVTTVFKQKFDGQETRINVSSLPDDVISTDNHPFLVIRAEDFTTRDRCKCWFGSKGKTKTQVVTDAMDRAQYVSAKDLKSGDFMVIPVAPEPVENVFFEQDQAYMMGMYLAEGCVWRERRSIPTRGKVRGGLTLSDNTFAQQCFDLLGGNSKTKRVAPEIFAQSDEWILDFLAGYFDGDGCLTNGRAMARYENMLTASTASRNLALDLQRLLASIGIPVSVNKSDNKESNGCLGKGDRPIYSISVGSAYSEIITKHCLRLKVTPGVSRKKQARGHTNGEYLLLPIRKVETQKSIQTEKFNFEVEEDNTYVTSVAGHNSNLNGDAFKSAICHTSHPSFMTKGALYRNHNANPKHKEGYVAKTAYNDAMGRVELLVAARHDKCADWLSDLEKKKPVKFSMGFSCEDPGDQCSICDHFARNRSEYCFTEDTQVLMAGGLVKSIRDVQEGDIVIDVDGQEVRVIKKFEREVCEEIVSFKNSLNGMVTNCTKNHPFLVLPGEACRFYNIDNCMYSSKLNDSAVCNIPNFSSFLPSPDFVAAGNLRRKDFIFCPSNISSSEVLGSDIDEEAAWVIGLFVAEGSYAKDSSGTRVSIQFSLNKKEVEHQERLREFSKSKWGRDLKVYSTSGSKGVSARIHSREAAIWFLTYAGEYAYQKAFHPGFFSASAQIKRALLSGIFDGDGHLYLKDGEEKSSRLNSASRNLISQVFLLTNSLGYFGYHSKFMNSGGPNYRSNTHDGFYLNTSYSFSGDCSSVSGGKGRIGQNLVGYIESIEFRPFDGVVYNIETESGTYVANWMSVHNCDHVKKKAAAPYGMNRILPDGRKCFVFNDYGHWNDISRVPTGADAIAMDLRKVAGVADNEVLGGSELADMYFLTQDSVDSNKVALCHKLSAMEKRIEALGTMRLAPNTRSVTKTALLELRKHALPEIFAQLAKVGAVLPFTEFYTLVFGSDLPVYDQAIKTASYSLSRAFTDLCGDPARLIAVVGNSTYNPAAKTASLVSHSQLRDIVADYGLQSELAADRVYATLLGGKTAARLAIPRSVETPQTRMLIDQYAAYKIAALTAIGAQDNDSALFYAVLNT